MGGSATDSGNIVTSAVEAYIFTFCAGITQDSSSLRILCCIHEIVHSLTFGGVTCALGGGLDTKNALSLALLQVMCIVETMVDVMA